MSGKRSGGGSQGDHGCSAPEGRDSRTSQAARTGESRDRRVCETTPGLTVASGGGHSEREESQSKDQKGEEKGKMKGKKSGKGSEKPGGLGSDPVGHDGTKDSSGTMVRGADTAGEKTQRPIPVAPPLSALLSHKDAGKQEKKGKGRAKRTDQAEEGASALASPPLIPSFLGSVYGGGSGSAETENKEPQMVATVSQEQVMQAVSSMMKNMSFTEKWRLLRLSEQEVEDLENGIPEKTARAAEPQSKEKHTLHSRPSKAMSRDEVVAREMQQEEWAAANDAAKALAQTVADDEEYAQTLSRSINGSDSGTSPCERLNTVAENAVQDTGELYVEVVRRGRKSNKKQTYKQATSLFDLTGDSGSRFQALTEPSTDGVSAQGESGQDGLEAKEHQAKLGLDEAGRMFQLTQDEHAAAYTECRVKEERIGQLREQLKSVQHEAESNKGTRKKLTINARIAAEQFANKLSLVAQQEADTESKTQDIARLLAEATREKEIAREHTQKLGAQVQDQRGQKEHRDHVWREARIANGKHPSTVPQQQFDAQGKLVVAGNAGEEITTGYRIPKKVMPKLSTGEEREQAKQAFNRLKRDYPQASTADLASLYQTECQEEARKEQNEDDEFRLFEEAITQAGTTDVNTSFSMHLNKPPPQGDRRMVTGRVDLKWMCEGCGTSCFERFPNCRGCGKKRTTEGTVEHHIPHGQFKSRGRGGRSTTGERSPHNGRSPHRGGRGGQGGLSSPPQKFHRWADDEFWGSDECEDSTSEENTSSALEVTQKPKVRQGEKSKASQLSEKKIDGKSSIMKVAKTEREKVPQLPVPIKTEAADEVSLGKPEKTETKTQVSHVDSMDAKEIRNIRKALASYNTTSLMKLPRLPLNRDRAVTDTVQFTSTLSRNVYEIREGAGDVTTSKDWVRGWDLPLEKHVLNALSFSADPTQAGLLRTKINMAFSQTRSKMEEGMLGADAMEFLVRTLGKVLGMVSVATIVYELQNLVVPVGTPFSAYMGRLRSLVQNAHSIGQVAPQDSTLQMAVRESVCDQFAFLAADVFKGRDQDVLPYTNIEELMKVLEALAWNDSPALEATRLTVGKTGGSVTGYKNVQGGITTKTNATSVSQPYKKGGYQAARKNVFNIEDEMMNEDEDFSKVYQIMHNHGGFGNKRDPPFYVKFNSRDEKDAARRAYGRRCLNCGDDDHFVRDCTQPYKNDSNILNPQLNEGNPQEAADRWSRWLQRLRQWHANRH